jgi:hypothetical protein
MNGITTMTRARLAILTVCNEAKLIPTYDASLITPRHSRILIDALEALDAALAPPTRKPASWLTTDNKFSHVETPGAIPLYRFEEANHESI